MTENFLNTAHALAKFTQALFSFISASRATRQLRRHKTLQLVDLLRVVFLTIGWPTIQLLKDVIGEGVDQWRRHIVELGHHTLRQIGGNIESPRFLQDTISPPQRSNE